MAVQEGNSTNAPKFFTIECANHPGYFITQQGTQLVLNSRNSTNPFQLWYRDDSWRFLDTNAYVFINHGSKKALRSQLLSSGSGPATRKATVGDYDPSFQDDSIIWSYDPDSNNVAQITLYSSSPSIHLAHGTRHSTQVQDGVPITSSRAAGWTKWTVAPYEPTTFYKIQCAWVAQFLTSKQRLLDFTPTNAVTHNDELNVVAVSLNNQLDGMAWYKVPAGGKQDTTFGSSFIVINRVTGFALKGSTKSGDKVILTQYDPLDYDFVWSENRAQTSGGPNFTVINLDGTTLQWHLQNDAAYQNGAFYHPLSLLPATANSGYSDRQAWNFIKG